MTTANPFLQAIQAKAQQQQKEREKDREFRNSIKPISVPVKVPGAGIVPLEKVADRIVGGGVPELPVKRSARADCSAVIVDREINTKRIVVHNLPDGYGRILVGEGWHWQVGSDTYFTKETPEALEVLGRLLDLDLGTEDNPLTEEDNQEIPEAIEMKPEESAEVSPEFARYRNQVDDLVSHLKIHPADLMLLAIDALHAKHFRSN